MAGGNKPGSPKMKGSGRKAGTPNKITLDLIKDLEDKGFYPAARLVRMIKKAEEEYNRNARLRAKVAAGEVTLSYVPNDGSYYLGLAMKATADLMKFVYPTRKAIDHTSNGESFFQSFSDAVKTVLQPDKNEQPGASTTKASDSDIPEPTA